MYNKIEEINQYLAISSFSFSFSDNDLSNFIADFCFDVFVVLEDFFEGVGESIPRVTGGRRTGRRRKRATSGILVIN
jgi:hypothetical protein